MGVGASGRDGVDSPVRPTGRSCGRSRSGNNEHHLHDAEQLRGGVVPAVLAVRLLPSFGVERGRPVRQGDGDRREGAGVRSQRNVDTVPVRWDSRSPLFDEQHGGKELCGRGHRRGVEEQVRRAFFVCLF